jgi:tetratricopeptide (TPR) repeat protein
LARELAEPQLKILGGILPELVAERSDVVLEQFESPEARHRQVQPALRQWLSRVAEERPLLLAINDVQRMDAPSAACVALVAREAKRQRMLVVVTQASDQAPPAHNQAALSLLAKTAVSSALAPLSPEHTQSVLGSVFGEVPNLELLSRNVHQTTAGNVRDVIALARHLVEAGSLRYEAGSWTLPSRLSAADLPPNMSDALKQRVEKLSTRARTLAYAISREPTLSFGVKDCAQLLPDTAPAALSAALKELAQAEILSVSAERYQCVQRSWIVPLTLAASAAEQRAAHLGLAQLFELRKDGFRQAGWLVRAGEDERGLDAMYQFAVASCAETDVSPVAFHALLHSVPEDWLKICAELLSLYDRYQRPPRQRFALLNRMAGIISRTGHHVECFGYIATMLRQLEHDSGLDCFADLPPDLAPAQRIPRALELAKQRYLATPEPTRVLDPGAALKQLLAIVITGIGNIATTSDYGAFRSLPALAPIVPLAPGLLVVHQLALGVGHRLAARSEDALALYHAMLQRLEQPDRAGLGPSHHFHIVTRTKAGMGALEAPMGRAGSLRWADEIETSEYEPAAALIRFLYHLGQGNTREARRFKRRFELLQLETNAISDMQNLFSELCLYALGSDMTGVRHAVDTLEGLAELHGAARAALHYGRGEYHAIRGDLTAALSELERALGMMKPGEHMVWSNAAAAHVRVLTALDRVAEARTLGEAYLASAEAAGLGYVLNHIRRPLSLALAKLGEHAQAQALIEAAVHVCDTLELSGLNAQLCFETAVQVALEADERARVQQHLQRCTVQFRLAFARDAQALDVRASQATPSDAFVDPSSEYDLETAFALCLVDGRSLAERAELGLDFVTRHLNAAGGALYLRVDNRLVRVAATGETDDDSVLRPWALRELAREESEQHTDLISQDAELEPRASAPQPEGPATEFESSFDAYTPVVLAHYGEHGFAVTGIMALRGRIQSLGHDAAVLGGELSRALGNTERAGESEPPAE